MQTTKKENPMCQRGDLYMDKPNGHPSRTWEVVRIVDTRAIMREYPRSSSRIKQIVLSIGLDRLDYELERLATKRERYLERIGCDPFSRSGAVQLPMPA